MSWPGFAAACRSCATFASAAPVASPAPAPLLAPLIGPLAWQAEVRSVVAEDAAALTPENQARVRGIPFLVDPNPFEINAYAACDEHGSPSIVGTEGLLEAIDAIAQTRATDELYGTHTYAQYMATVIPNLVQFDKALGSGYPDAERIAASPTAVSRYASARAPHRSGRPWLRISRRTRLPASNMSTATRTGARSSSTARWEHWRSAATQRASC